MSSRRSILRGLAALPAIGLPALPSMAAVAAVSPSPDAEIIALAARVKALAEREADRWEHYADVQDRTFLGPFPPEPEFTFAGSKELGALACRVGASEMLNEEPDPAVVQRMAILRTERDELQKTYDVEHAAWREQCDKIRHPPACRAAERLVHRAVRRLERATESLAEMRPTTLAGLVAKAGAVRLDKRSGHPEDHQRSTSPRQIIEDLQAMGGAHA